MRRSRSSNTSVEGRAQRWKSSGWSLTSAPQCQGYPSAEPITPHQSSCRAFRSALSALTLSPSVHPHCQSI